ncbi:transcriptional regulator BetI [Acinetobacter schindleri]|jgi:TetR/AcrR family transcriptional repressor of bet genes|uniref:transcriptional regulator BetI n=1 Tax=Acinetobacter schindleri TaxID=108981 RepID=UPI0013B07000|nr:transcriptional regulator BetI [Acinetobacter schindleri]MEB5928444.1 transcriptional regulator BetI [Acinetobacter schindleri]QIC59878.1 transcriptional regulator BetI [Acinetobacter schindleri]
MPKVGMQPIRRQQLIDATLAAVNELGFAESSISQIAQRAGVSTGIISHYFGGKNGLIEATMRYLLQQLGKSVAEMQSQVDSTPEQRLLAIVRGNFAAPQTDKAAMKVWLAFWASSLHQPDLHRLQQVNHYRLHSNIKHEFMKVLPKAQAEKAAQGLAALIDGFWLRGALINEELDPEMSIELCSDYIRQQLKNDSTARESH